jgi:hypothetical protein
MTPYKRTTNPKYPLPSTNKILLIHAPALILLLHNILQKPVGGRNDWTEEQNKPTMSSFTK